MSVLLGLPGGEVFDASAHRLLRVLDALSVVELVAVSLVKTCPTHSRSVHDGIIATSVAIPHRRWNGNVSWKTLAVVEIQSWNVHSENNVSFWGASSHPGIRLVLEGTRC